MIRWVGFDADDTLWQSQSYFDAAQEAYEQILSRYLDVADDRVHAHLLETERRNVRFFGYGAKGMILSMLEAAVALTEERISGADVRHILELGMDVLQHPVELLPGAREAVEQVARHYEIVLITKGDLHHQERKVAESGLNTLFHHIEIVSEKDPPTYARLFAEFGCAAEEFAMVGNSLRSDIAPVVELGGWGIYMPYHSTWSLETDPHFAVDNPRVIQVSTASSIPTALDQLGALARR